jgi:hypothetical protein
MPLDNYRNLLVSSIHHDIIRRRRQRIMNRRINRTYRRHIPTNNANTFLSLNTQLPLQITNNPLENQLFNGSLSIK